jgi:thiamine-monophosphate kinase
MIRGIADACMDTSDGVLATLDQLMRVNGVGFQLDGHWSGALDLDAVGLANHAGIPAWLLLAGQHGEYELLFTVAPEREQELLNRAVSVHWHPARLGTVISQPEIRLDLYGSSRSIDTARVRNASFTAGAHVGEYIQELLTIDRDLQKGNGYHGHQ